MINILIDVPIYKPSLEKLKSVHDVSVSICDPISEDAMLRPKHLIKDAELLFCSEPPNNLTDTVNLKWMQISSSGFEHLISMG